jgi:hypothetical protein
MSIRGIDVASYQSERPDLDGMDFCFVKATEGTSYVNPKMRAQADHARRHGLVVGFYHFVRPGSMRAQAAYFVRECASQPGDPLWLDWEDPGVSCADKDDFLREVARLRGDDHRVGLYCSTSYWLHRDTTSFAGDALWIAHYGVGASHPRIQAHWLFHQYTSSPIDTSVGRFSSRSALRDWATGGTHSTSKEDDMPSAREIAEAVWNWDGIEPLSPTKANPKHQPENVLTEMLQRLDRVERGVKQLTARGAARDAVLARLAEGGGLTAAEIQSAAEAGARAALAELGETLTKEN